MQRPTQPGFYWVYAPAGVVLATQPLFSVIQLADDGSLGAWGHFAPGEFERFFGDGCFWAGPIPQPEGPLPGVLEESP